LIYFDTGRKSTCCVTGTSKIENVSRIAWVRGWIQPVCLRGRISVILGSQVSLPVHYRKKEEVYFTTLLWQNKGRQNGLTSRLLFSKLNKIMVKKVTFVGLRGGQSTPLWSQICILLFKNNATFCAPLSVLCRKVGCLLLSKATLQFVTKIFFTVLITVCYMSTGALFFILQINRQLS